MPPNSTGLELPCNGPRIPMYYCTGLGRRCMPTKTNRDRTTLPYLLRVDEHVLDTMLITAAGVAALQREDRLACVTRDMRTT